MPSHPREDCWQVDRHRRGLALVRLGLAPLRTSRESSSPSSEPCSSCPSPPIAPLLSASAVIRRSDRPEGPAHRNDLWLTLRPRSRPQKQSAPTSKAAYQQPRTSSGLGRPAKPPGLSGATQVAFSLSPNYLPRPTPLPSPLPIPRVAESPRALLPDLDPLQLEPAPRSGMTPCHRSPIPRKLLDD